MVRKYHQGIYTPHNPQKYRGNVKNIVFRSSWEKMFCKYCDFNPNVRFWSSEEASEGMVIPYISPKDNMVHRYFMDFKIITKSNKVILIEVKPFNQTKEPKPQKRQTKKFINECMTYAVNEAKWKAAKVYCKKMGWEFKIITEKELFKGKKKR